MNNEIKMFIANEEVVCSKDFTIKEEMLSASSTILNNCYPASWELSKDYVSEFYYPKDYSKFVLARGNFVDGNDEYSIRTAEGNTFLGFETNVEKEYAGLKVYGNTYQETSTQSANLFDEDYYRNATYATNIYKYTLARIKGTGTKLYTKASLKSGKTNISGLYMCLSSTPNPNSSGSKYSMLVRDGALYNGNFTPDNNIDLYFSFYPATVSVSDIFDTYNIWVSTTDTSYTPFIPNSPSPDYPSELVSVGYTNYFDISKVITNGTRVINNGDSLTINTTSSSPGASATSPNKLKDYCPTLKVGDTVYLLANTTGSSKFIYLSVSQLYWGFGSKRTITQNDLDSIVFWYASGLSTTATISNIAVMKKVYTYVPYGKYAVKVVNTGKNLLGFPNSVYADTASEDDVTVSISLNRIRLMGKLNTTPAGQRSFAFLGTLSNTFFANYGIYFSNPNTITLSAGTYTLSLQKRQGYIDSTWVRFYVLKNTPTTPHTQIINLNLLNEFSKSFTLTEETDVYFTLDYTNNTEFLFLFNLQLEKSPVETPYEEHKENSQLYLLNEPVRAIGDTKDLLYIDNGKLYVERKIGSVVLNGTENWQKRTDYSYTNYSVFRNADYRTGQFATGSLGYSNYFNVYTNQQERNQIRLVNTNGYGTQITIENSKASTNAEIKTWLSTNNTEVQYILTTPYTEEVGIVNVPTAYENINNVVFDTGLNTDEEVSYYWKNYDVLFSGVIKNSGDISLNPRYPHYCSLQVLDYKTFLSEGDMLDFVISDKTIAEAIQMVVNAISGYGFVVGNININQANDKIGAYSTLDKTAYDVFQYLANISGSRWRARYLDSSTMAIDFYDPDLLPQAPNINYTTQYWDNNNIVDLSFNFGTRDYRNKQVMLSDQVYANILYNETILSNGYSTTFVLTQNVAQLSAVSIGGVLQTIATTEEKEQGVDADFYYEPGKNVIESSATYSAGTQIIVSYIPLVKGRQIVYNNDEIERIANETNTSGVIARYETRNDILSNNELDQIGQSYIEYKGKAEIVLTLVTHNKDLFNIGEVTYFNSPIENLKQKYMVKSKSMEFIVNNDIKDIFYTYELTSSFNSEKSINYFDNQRNKVTGNIAVGETITRNIDIENYTSIVWEGLQIRETSGENNNNILNCILNSPFTQ